MSAVEKLTEMDKKVARLMADRNRILRIPKLKRMARKKTDGIHRLLKSQKEKKQKLLEQI